MKAYLNVLLGVLEVLEEGVFSPDDTTFLVGGRVRVAIGHTRLATEETVKVGSLLVCTTLFNSVALTALGLEDLGSLLFAHGVLSYFPTSTVLWPPVRLAWFRASVRLRHSRKEGQTREKNEFRTLRWWKHVR